MRTTLDIDDDVFLAVREIAEKESRTVGSVVSDLIRNVLIKAKDSIGQRGAESKYGFRPFANRGSVVTNQLIDKLREVSGC